MLRSTIAAAVRSSTTSPGKTWWPFSRHHARRSSTGSTGGDTESSRAGGGAAGATGETAGGATTGGCGPSADASTAGSRFFNSHTLNRFGLDLSETLAGWDDDNAKALWVGDPLLSGARELIETEFLLRDWGEIIVADTIVGVPLYYEPILRFFAVTAGLHGDSVTPAVAGGMLAQAEREYRWARELLRVALEVDANRPIIEEWLERWVPLALTAHQRLSPLYQQVTRGPLRYESEQTRANGRAAATLSELGLSTATLKAKASGGVG